jgi:hypothetical protein
VKLIQRTCSIQLSSKQKRTGRHERSDSDRSAEMYHLSAVFVSKTTFSSKQDGNRDAYSRKHIEAKEKRKSF